MAAVKDRAIRGIRVFGTSLTQDGGGGKNTLGEKRRKADDDMIDIKKRRKKVDCEPEVKKRRKKAESETEVKKRKKSDEGEAVKKRKKNVEEESAEQVKRRKMSDEDVEVAKRRKKGDEAEQKKKRRKQNTLGLERGADRESGDEALPSPEQKKVGRPNKCALDHIYSQKECYITKHQPMITEAIRETCKERAEEGIRLKYYPDPDYIKKQCKRVFSLNQRLRFIKVIWEICNPFNASKLTFALSVRLMDRYASKVKLEKDFVFVLPFACFSIACKYIETKCFTMGTYSKHFKEVKNAKQVIQMERHVLKMIDYQVDDILPLQFAERHFLFAGCELKRHLKKNKEMESKQVTSIVTRFMLLLWYLLELLSVDYDMLRYAHLPHLIPAACIYATSLWTRRLPWNEYKGLLLKELQVTEEEFMPVFNHLEDILVTDFPERCGMYTKYDIAKRGNISSKISEFMKKRKSEDT